MNGRYHSDRVESHIILPSHLTLRRSGAALRFSSLTCNPSERKNAAKISRVCEYKTVLVYEYTNSTTMYQVKRVNPWVSVAPDYLRVPPLSAAA